MTTRKAAQAPSPFAPEASYHVALRRSVPMPGLTYRPGEAHVMTGARLLEVLAAAGVTPEAAGDLCATEPVAPVASDAPVAPDAPIGSSDGA